jgi:hypothetical protein
MEWREVLVYVYLTWFSDLFAPLGSIYNSVMQIQKYMDGWLVPRRLQTTAKFRNPDPLRVVL